MTTTVNLSTVTEAVTVDLSTTTEAVTLTVAQNVPNSSEGGGAVDSVNGETGVVVLDADDISDSETTNKFATEAELTKLANIEAGATANSTDAALLNRENHTGTQAISTVVGLQDALNNKEPADATILKFSAIGVTVQAYSADTVIDANYVATENSYTTAEKNKLAGIEAGAEVNVNADWDAVSGDAEILNKPTLGTAAALDVGTSASQVVQLDGSARLPAVDGSQLTNLPAGFTDPMTTAGDIIIRNGSNTTTRLGVGSEGQVLKVSSGVPAWAAESGGGGSGLTPVPVTNAQSPYTANANELLLVDTSAGAVVINLPASGSDAIVQVSDVGGNAGTNGITINRAGSDTILGDTAMTVTDDYAGAILAIDSTQTDWKVAGFTVPLGGSGGGGSGLSNPVDTLYRSIQTVTYNDAGTSTMDNGTHDVFSLTANGTSTTLTHSNVPTTGNEYTFRLHLTWTSGSITWPASWTKGMNAPTATGNYIIQGVTIDGGTSWTISVVYQ